MRALSRASRPMLFQLQKPLGAKLPGGSTPSLKGVLFAQHKKRISYPNILARFQHNFALTRKVPNSFVDSLSSYAAQKDPIDLALAKSQHDVYVSLLRAKVPTLELPPLEAHPDSVFVEDTAVAIGNRAVLTCPGHESRQGEVDSIAAVLEQLGMEVWDMKQMDPTALCDGGDVLYTGRHLFVGLSNRTNQQGVQVLKEAFEDDNMPVIAVPMDANDALHLKSIITHLDERTLLAPAGTVGDKVLESSKAEDLGYQVVRLPDIHTCNVVSLNGFVLASETTCEKSSALLEEAVKERGLTLQWVNSSEIAKSDGACTCCSILLSL